MSTTEGEAAGPDPARDRLDATAAADDAAGGGRESAGRAGRWWHPARWSLSWSGLVGATVGLWAALSPSLLPRPPLFLGLIGGVGVAVGYGSGVCVAWLLRLLGIRRWSPPARAVAWKVLAVAGPLAALTALVLSGGWQNQVRVLVGEAPQDTSWPFVAVLAAVTAAALVLAGRGVRRATRLLGRGLGRVLPRRVAVAAAVVVVGVCGYLLAVGVAEHGLLAMADRVYGAANDTTDAGVEPVTAPERSGSPPSLVSWASLGKQGRTFVAGGPSVAEMSALSGRPAMEPIRVYVGVESAPDAAGRARLAVAELERTHAFDRAVLVVAGATGTGWLEPQSTASLEYLWNGDSAIVTIQYSYLPSWMSTLVDAQRAADAGRELFDAVHTAWEQQPVGHRPKLISYGLSLGSFAAQSAFATAADITSRTDGALFVGSPSFSQPWGDITRLRDAPSPQWQPVYRSGQSVRFAATATDLAKPGTVWSTPRVVYLQHASDPVVWWSTDLILRRPDWLDEPPGPDVEPAMRWWPGLTFVQVTVDQFFGVSVPNGHGHNYANTMVAAWVAVTQPAGWSPTQLTTLQALIDQMPLT